MGIDMAPPNINATKPKIGRANKRESGFGNPHNEIIAEIGIQKNKAIICNFLRKKFNCSSLNLKLPIWDLFLSIYPIKRLVKMIKKVKRSLDICYELLSYFRISTFNTLDLFHLPRVLQFIE